MARLGHYLWKLKLPVAAAAVSAALVAMLAGSSGTKLTPRHRNNTPGESSVGQTSGPAPASAAPYTPTSDSTRPGSSPLAHTGTGIPPNLGQSAVPAGCAIPPVDLGADAYKHLGNLSFLDLLSRASGQTTADPATNNDDWPNVVRPVVGGGAVLLDQAGPGVITFLRMQETTGAPWQLSVDGASPTTISQSDLGQLNSSSPAAISFPLGLSFRPDQSQGSSVVMGSIPFQQSAKLSSASGNGNFYSLLRRLPYGTPVGAWSPMRPSSEVVDALQRPATTNPPANLATTQGTLDLKGRSSNQVVDLQGPRQIRMLQFAVPAAQAAALGNSTLQITWDGDQQPSVDAPIKFLAGDGAGVYQPAGRPLVNGLLARAGTNEAGLFQFDLLWPMPYKQDARVSITSTIDASLNGVRWKVGTEPFNVPSTWWAPLHATYTSISQPTPGRDMVFLDVGGSGRIVGTVINFGKVGTTLEGNPRIYLDNSETPQVQATGTEEWGLGGNYWQGGNQVTLPLGGLPSADNNPAGTDVDGASLYRMLVADSIPFNRRAKVLWEHGALDNSTEPYRTTVIWYGTPATTAHLSDTLITGTPASADSHKFTGASLTTTRIAAGFAYRSDSPAIQQDVSASLGATSFTMAVSPRAAGAFLRRTYDAASRDQRAAVYIDGVFAGTWYSAGGFSKVDRFGVTRRLVEDEFPLPPSLIAGKRTINLELRNAPIPGLTNGPWTAIRYQLYSMVAVGC